MPLRLRIDVGSLGALTPHSFCRQEAARSNGDSLVVNRQRALQAGNPLLRLLQLVHGVAGNRLQVGDVVLQRANLIASSPGAAAGCCGWGAGRFATCCCSCWIA